MKKSLLYLGVMLSLLISVVSCSTNEPVQECPLDHKPTEVPTLSIELLEVTANSVRFTLTPVDAASVRYTICEKSSIPAAESLFNKSSDFYGKIADATITEEYSFEGLEMNTEYVVYAAAKNDIGYSEMASVALTTLIPEMSFSVVVTETTHSSMKFEVELQNVGEAAYMLCEAGATPTADEVLADGVQMATEDGKSEYVVNNLEVTTTYQIVVAVSDLTMANSQVQNVEFTTQKRPDPRVGDFYYADGTWSSELDAEANPIGVVFHVGKHSTDSSSYMMKDGATAMGEFHGYVVAAWDATYDATNGSNNGTAWGKQGTTVGTSTSLQDFMGYSNSMKVLADANGALENSSSDNYPAFYCAMVKYEESYPAPSVSSGWFMPSAYQLLYIWEEFDPTDAEEAVIENQLALLAENGLGAKMYVRDSEYWSSTEYSNSPDAKANYVVFDEASTTPGRIDNWNKRTDMRVRSILAF
jgi:hypothetical protein